MGNGEERVNGVKEKGKMVVEWERGMNGRGQTSGDGDKNVESWKWGGWIKWLGSVRREWMVWKKGGGGMLGKYG